MLHEHSRHVLSFLNLCNKAHALQVPPQAMCILLNMVHATPFSLTGGIPLWIILSDFASFLDRNIIFLLFGVLGLTHELHEVDRLVYGQTRLFSKV